MNANERELEVVKEFSCISFASPAISGSWRLALQKENDLANPFVGPEQIHMNTNHELLLRQEVYKVIGCAIEVLNAIGHGLHEKPYENALVVEFRDSRSLAFIRG